MLSYKLKQLYRLLTHFKWNCQSIPVSGRICKKKTSNYINPLCAALKTWELVRSSRGPEEPHSPSIKSITRTDGGERRLNRKQLEEDQGGNNIKENGKCSKRIQRIWHLRKSFRANNMMREKSKASQLTKAVYSNHLGKEVPQWNRQLSASGLSSCYNGTWKLVGYTGTKQTNFLKPLFHNEVKSGRHILVWVSPEEFPLCCTAHTGTSYKSHRSETNFSKITLPP